jgi:predicted deacylase
MRRPIVKEYRRHTRGVALTQRIGTFVRAVAALVATVAPAAFAQVDNPTFTAGTATAARGQRALGVLEVPPGPDAGVHIPVAVMHGAWPGPVLTVVAGVHGTEYASIVAAERLIDRVDPTDVTGTLVIVPVANVLAFEHKAMHVNPADGKNLNRVFPGRADGTQSERIAYALTRLVEKSDMLVDMHGGDLDESLRPYTYWTRGGNERVDATSREMALAFGIDHIILATDRPRDPAASRYLDNTAITRGKATITVEAGYAGRVAPDDVDLLVNGCLSVMRQFKMLPGRPTPVDRPVWIDSVRSVTSEHTGIFYPSVQRGAFVEQGMKIGSITDLLGRRLAEPRSPASGIVLFVNALPSIRRGETIANIGTLAPRAPAGPAQR